MAIITTWNIVGMDCKPDVNGKLNYVVTAHWTLNSATNGTYTGSVYGTVSFEVDPDKPDYTHYADLTLAQVVAWVQAALGADGVAYYEKSVADQLQKQITPPMVTLPLPWVDFI